MTQIMRYFVLNLLGFALAAFGVYAAVNSYPGSGQLTAMYQVMPTLWAVLAFALSIAVALAGLALLVPALGRFRLRRSRITYPGANSAYSRGVPSARPMPARQVEEFEEDPSYPDYGPAGSYPGGYGPRHHDNGDYAEFEDRRSRASYR